ncbi:hypothetical protein BT93_D0675 [Corymbia citriodora subsp. variegata]|nr:hypothetical protein BT93_D0675 [Corymbia citriodora subsp. variegata]
MQTEVAGMFQELRMGMVTSSTKCPRWIHSLELPSSMASRDKSAEKASSSTDHYNLSKSSELFKWNNGRPKGHELPASDSTFKYRKMGTGFLAENSSIVDYTSIFDVIDSEGKGSNTRYTWNYQETEAGSPNATPEELLKEENGGGNSSFLATRGKALALRAKPANRTSLATDAESNWTNPIREAAGDDMIANEHLGLQKASSVSSLRIQEATDSSSIWQTSKWSLKPDLPLFSAASLTGPIGLALPISISGWRSKAALD